MFSYQFYEKVLPLKNKRLNNNNNYNGVLVNIIEISNITRD